MTSQHMSAEIERLEKEQKELHEACRQAEEEAASIEKAERERGVRVFIWRLNPCFRIAFVYGHVHRSTFLII